MISKKLKSKINAMYNGTEENITLELVSELIVNVLKKPAPRILNMISRKEIEQAYHIINE